MLVQRRNPSDSLESMVMNQLHGLPYCFWFSGAHGVELLAEINISRTVACCHLVCMDLDGLHELKLRGDLLSHQLFGILRLWVGWNMVEGSVVFLSRIVGRRKEDLLTREVPH
ncbi:hypothetical protein Tco_1359435 [Tanacetum coccineum]